MTFPKSKLFWKGLLAMDIGRELMFLREVGEGHLALNISLLWPLLNLWSKRLREANLLGMVKETYF